MLSQQVKVILALIATILFAIFIFGLSHSISTGFAGFWGGLPFAIIATAVVGMAFYDLWDETIRRKD
jgi:predicted transporter